VTFSDLLSAGGPWGRPLAEAAVDYVNFHLEDDKVLTCVHYGLFLARQGREPSQGDHGSDARAERVSRQGHLARAG